MANARVFPSILYRDFPRFVGLFAGDRDFPIVYDAWATSYATRVADAKANGEIVMEQVVRPIEFMEWCYANDLPSRWDSLQPFAEFTAKS